MSFFIHQLFEFGSVVHLGYNSGKTTSSQGGHQIFTAIETDTWSVSCFLSFVRHGDKTKQAIEHHRKNLQQQGATLTFLPTAPRAVGVRVFTFTARSLI